MSVAAQDQGDYSYWYRAAIMTEGKRPLTRDEMKSLGLTHEAGCGFFRRRLSRAGQFVPVAIFMHNGEMVAVCDGKPADAAEVWTYCAAHPITEDAYRARMESGRWPDEDSGTTASLSPPSRDGIGGNNPPQDEADILAAQIEAASANAKDYENIADDETAARAQSCRARLNELASKADRTREVEKKPHLEAGRAVDKKWKSIIERAEGAAKRIRDALSAHETRKANAARAAEQARLAAEAERARILREQLAANPEAPTTDPAAIRLPSEQSAAPVAPVTQIRGAHGKAASVKVAYAVTMTDSLAAAQSMHAAPEMIELMTKLAQRAANAGFLTIPGFTVTEERKVS